MNNLERAADVIDQYFQHNTITRDTGNPRDLARTLADAGLLAGEYVELAPHHRFGIGRAKDSIILSDNTDRTTIRIPHDDVSDLIMGLIMAKEED